jgi:predicted enzyme related to lactoylglutathione lyase
MAGTALEGKTMSNTIAHSELATTDLDGAKKFYGALFDWKLEDFPMPDGNGTYTFIRVDGEGAGGMLQQPMPGAPSAWVPYVNIDEIAAASKKAQSLGARVLKDVQEIPGMGAFCVLADPSGAVFGLWESR